MNGRQEFQWHTGEAERLNHSSLYTALLFIIRFISKLLLLMILVNFSVFLQHICIIMFCSVLFPRCCVDRGEMFKHH